MAFKKRLFAPLAAATLAAYTTPNSEAATMTLPGSSHSNAIVDQLVGIAGDNDQIRVYGDDALHYFSRDLTNTGQTGTLNNVDAMVHSSTLDGLADSGDGYSTITTNSGAGEFSRGFANAQQTRALHGHVTIAGVDYTLATTNNSSGDLTTAWYNTSNVGGGPIAQTIDIAPMMSELGISTADQITGGAMYLSEGGNTENLSHYIPMWNTTELIGQYNPLTGDMNSFETGADGIQDIHVQGNDIYVVDALAPGIGSVSRHDFSSHHMNAVPEPSSAVLLGLGALGALAYRRKRE